MTTLEIVYFWIILGALLYICWAVSIGNMK